MSKTNRHPVRRTAAGVLAGALALSGAFATPAFSAVGFDLVRIQGDDRYETSAAIATAFGAATEVILASGEQGRTPDALAANFLAGVRNAPVLLTRRDTTPPSILAAIRASGATRITVVGGPVAVSDVQIESLRTAGFTVTRVAGANRYETAAAVAAAGEGATASNTGLVASGVSTIDALAGGPLAYRGRHPLFLVTRDGIPGATLASMRANGITNVFILGGEAVVGPRVVAQLTAAGITINGRLAGANRSETSVAIANALITSFGFSANTFNLASGLNEGIDALGGAALSGKEGRVLLITNNAASAAPVTGFATTRAATLNAAGRVFGGPTVVAEALVTGVETAAGATASNQTFTVTPNTAATLTLANEGAATATVRDADNRTFSATGLTNGTTYRITLVDAANVTIGANGAATFLASADADSPSGFSANAGTPAAVFTTVNNVASAPNLTTTTVTPVNGSVTFTIDGTAPGTVIPVLYVNGGGGGTATTGGTSTRLELTATAAGQRGVPSESFGLGGATTFVPAELGNGNFTGTAGSVTSVNKTTDSFALTVTGTPNFAASINYDANDLFFVNEASVGLAAFEAALSTGDTVSGSYAADAGGVSTLRLTDLAPAAPATVTAAFGTGASSNDVTLTVDTGSQSVDSVQIERAPVTNNVAGTFATIATPTTDASTTLNGFQYVDNDVPAGTYQYRASIIKDGDTGPATTSGNVVVVAPSNDTTAPTALDTRLATNAGNPLLVDNNDTFTIVFSEAVAAPAANATLRLTDTDGTVVFVTNGQGGASFTRNGSAVTIGGTEYAANRVVTVTVGTVTASTAGTIGGLAIPATIAQAAGLNDVAGNAFNIAGSSDVVVDTE